MADARRPARKNAPKGYAQTVYQEITRAENRSVLVAVGMFVGGVAFFSSSLSDFMIVAS